MEELVKQYEVDAFYASGYGTPKAFYVINDGLAK